MNLQSKKHEFMYNSPLIQLATARLKICHIIDLCDTKKTAKKSDRS